MTNLKLYNYHFYEAGKYIRTGYVWELTLKRVKAKIQKDYFSPSRIKIRLIGEETEEYWEQAKIRKTFDETVQDSKKAMKALKQRGNG